MAPATVRGEDLLGKKSTRYLKVPASLPRGDLRARSLPHPTGLTFPERDKGLSSPGGRFRSLQWFIRTFAYGPSRNENMDPSASSQLN